MKPFNIPIRSLEEANLLLDVLAAYDVFQYENNIKPDFCNAGGLVVWNLDADGEGNPGWVDWHDEETDEGFDDWRRENLPDRYTEIKKEEGMK